MGSGLNGKEGVWNRNRQIVRAVDHPRGEIDI
jgi:hypothetical protein